VNNSRKGVSAIIGHRYKEIAARNMLNTTENPDIMLWSATVVLAPAKVALINFNDCAGSSNALGMLLHVYEHSLPAEHSPVTGGLTAEAVLQSYYCNRYSAHHVVGEQRNFREREVAVMEPRTVS
jgi:hypothetical protein